MKLIGQAYAADEAVPTTTSTTEVPSGPVPTVPTSDPLIMNIGMVVVMGALFYLLLIRPQQKRYKEHNDMLGKLDKGSKVVTQGGLVGVIEKSISDSEVLVDFGNGIKMSVMRSYILGRYEDSLTSSVANDASKKKDKNSK